jgi:hypothetical protein
MVVKALLHVQTPDLLMDRGDIRTINDLNLVQSLIASGYVVEVEQCSCCGSYVNKQ